MSSEPLLDTKISSLFQRAMSATGFSTTSLAITAAIGVLGFVGHKYDNYISGLARYDEGYQAAIDDLGEAQTDLDEDTDIYLGEHYSFSEGVDAEIEYVEQEYEEEKDNAVTDLKTAINDHGKAIAVLQNSDRPKTTWGSTPVPNSVRLRFKRRDTERERDSGGHRKSDSSIND